MCCHHFHLSFINVTFSVYRYFLKDLSYKLLHNKNVLVQLIYMTHEQYYNIIALK